MRYDVADPLRESLEGIEDFFQRAGGAYDSALILDADSLLEGSTMVEMARRMEAEPRLAVRARP